MGNVHTIAIMQFRAGFRIQWTCTAPDKNREQYIPSAREMNCTALAALTESGVLLIYRVPNLGTNCYGQVTAIEYCYGYNASAVTGQVTFNWMILVLKDTGSSFEISSTYIIESRDSVGGASCTSSGGQVTCCDRTNINGFDLPQNFIFGVTESSHGNTAGATLLGFYDSLPQYQVDVILFNKAEVTLSMGSTIHSSPTIKRGIRMLWFVIGKC